MYIDLKRLRRSLNDAFEGLKLIVIEENSLRIEILIGVAVFVASFLFPLSRIERIIVIILIFFVMLAEILNTIAERILDLFKKNFDEEVQKIKHKSAAFVLILGILSLIVGLIIFTPYFFNAFR